MKRDEAREALLGHDVLISCEGTCEAVIVERLLDANKLIVDKDDLVWDHEQNTPYTLMRNAKRIETAFMGVEYPRGPLLVARIVDVNAGPFNVSRARRGDVMSLDFVTRQEIEVLIFIKEGRYDEWKRKHGKSHGKQDKASEYCRRELKMPKVKTWPFLSRYWNDADEIVRCIKEYRSKLGKAKNDELGLYDLLK